MLRTMPINKKKNLTDFIFVLFPGEDPTLVCISLRCQFSTMLGRSAEISYDALPTTTNNHCQI